MKSQKKLNHPPIEGKSLRLRLLEQEDLERIRLWRNQDNVRQWFNDTSLIEPEQHEAWFNQYLNLNNDYLYIIEKLTSPIKPIGQVAIYNIDWQHLTADYGKVIIVEEALRRKVLLLEVTTILVDYWKQKFGLRKLNIQVKCNNYQVLEISRRFGFQIEGKVDNLILMSLSTLVI